MFGGSHRLRFAELMMFKHGFPVGLSTRNGESMTGNLLEKWLLAGIWYDRLGILCV